MHISYESKVFITISKFYDTNILFSVMLSEMKKEERERSSYMKICNKEKKSITLKRNVLYFHKNIQQLPKSHITTMMHTIQMLAH